MKKKVLFTKNMKQLTLLLILSLCFNVGWAQTELVLNGTADEHGTGADTSNTSDNADAWDMTPNSTLNGDITSPYAAIWKNNDLEDALEIKYLGAAGSLDEQPGSTSSGNNGTRGLKLYDDGNPSITGSSRRLYQLVQGLTVGSMYNFSMDSKSEAANTPSEVYILNTEITDEVGIDANGYSDSSVVTGMSITNDEGSWTTTTFSFTATTTEVVIYVRSLSSVDQDTEVFYDNISLKENVTASVDKVFGSNFSVYPNPTKNTISIRSSVSIDKAEVFNVIGKKVISSTRFENNSIDVSKLSKGVYFLKVTSGDAIATKKIIKE